MSTLKELQDLIREKYDIETSHLDPKASIREQGLDSLALAEFLFEVEDRMGVSLPNDDPELDTLEALAERVDRARAKQAA